MSRVDKYVKKTQDTHILVVRQTVVPANEWSRRHDSLKVLKIMNVPEL